MDRLISLFWYSYLWTRVILNHCLDRTCELYEGHDIFPVILDPNTAWPVGPVCPVWWSEHCEIWRETAASWQPREVSFENRVLRALALTAEVEVGDNELWTLGVLAVYPEEEGAQRGPDCSITLFKQTHSRLQTRVSHWSTTEAETSESSWTGMKESCHSLILILTHLHTHFHMTRHHTGTRKSKHLRTHSFHSFSMVTLSSRCYHGRSVELWNNVVTYDDGGDSWSSCG